MPAGLLVTVPPPVPAFLTVNIYEVVFKAKVAVTVLVSLMVTAQAPVPLQAPPQPTKVELGEGSAVRVTTVPGEYVSLQSVPHSIPGGVLVMDPVPVPVLDTVNT